MLLFISQTAFPVDRNTVELKQISKHAFLHTSYSLIDGAWIDSHGLLIVNGRHIVLVDTCWTNDQTSILLKLIADKFHSSIRLAIITHAHQDRIGGIDTLLKNRIRTISTSLTAQKASLAGYSRPSPELDGTVTVYRLDNSESSDCDIEVFYPGPGHTEDNITVWIPADDVLFGACLVKAAENKSIGNVADAVVGKWASSVQALQKRYPNAKIVVPGHGNIGDSSLLQHTIDLVNGYIIGKR